MRDAKNVIALEELWFFLPLTSKSVKPDMDVVFMNVEKRILLDKINLQFHHKMLLIWTDIDLFCRIAEIVLCIMETKHNASNFMENRHNKNRIIIWTQMYVNWKMNWISDQNINW